jgi:hypothetical protein
LEFENTKRQRFDWVVWKPTYEEDFRDGSMKGLSRKNFSQEYWIGIASGQTLSFHLSHPKRVKYEQEC